MFTLLMFLFLLIFIPIAVLFILTLCYLIMFKLTNVFYRDKTMDVKPSGDHQIRILTLEDGHFQEEVLYRLKKG